MIYKKITSEDFDRAAEALGVPVAAIKAVTDVESRGSGFLNDGRPVVLFERHIMRRQLMKRDLSAAVKHFSETHPDVVNQNPGGYLGGASEWSRMARAIDIHRDSALESASWGLFQIMGFHWNALGYSSVQDFVNAMYKDEGSQLDAFVRFIKINPNLLRALKAQDWTAFARGYNGPAYEKNRYDTKLASAFARHNTEVA